MKQNDVTLHPVDELGGIRAQIAELRKREKEIEESLKPGPHDGQIFRAMVTVFDRNVVAWKDVAQHFSPSYQLIVAHTSTQSIRQVKVTARSTDKVA